MVLMVKNLPAATENINKRFFFPPISDATADIAPATMRDGDSTLDPASGGSSNCGGIDSWTSTLSLRGSKLRLHLITTSPNPPATPTTHPVAKHVRGELDRPTSRHLSLIKIDLVSRFHVH